mmetsp:Transcript_4375/g.15143  ORF Transcript_4375/g.15143 Transcript_4375/m.15143 type:complete len:254 (+) Transcript_4375:387-1148(+)
MTRCRSSNDESPLSALLLLLLLLLLFNNGTVLSSNTFINKNTHPSKHAIKTVIHKNSFIKLPYRPDLNLFFTCKQYTLASALPDKTTSPLAFQDMVVTKIMCAFRAAAMRFNERFLELELCFLNPPPSKATTSPSALPHACREPFLFAAYADIGASRNAQIAAIGVQLVVSNFTKYPTPSTLIPQKKNSPVFEKLAPRKTFKQFGFLEDEGNPLQLNRALVGSGNAVILSPLSIDHMMAPFVVFCCCSPCCCC